VFGETFNQTAFRFNPYLGYNWQIAPRWVLGLEGDAGFASKTTDLRGGDYPSSIFTGGAPNSFAVKTTWDASIRGRAGFLVAPAVLFYLTGGPAWLHVESTSNCSTALLGGDCSSAFGPSVITNSTTKLGLTVGTGVEAMLWPNWIIRGEYRYSDFGAISNSDLRTCPTGCGLPFTESVNYDVKLRTHTATFGIAYKFGDSSTTALASAAPLDQRIYAKAPTVLSWTGFYLGADVGVRATASTATLDSVTILSTGSPPFNAFTDCSNPKLGGCFFNDPLNGTAFRFSPYFGYNWQFARSWVAGIEGDFGWANQKTTLAGKNTPGTPLASFTGTANETFGVRTTWDASLRGRIGYLVNPSLLAYAAAGPAWLHVEQTTTCDTGFYGSTFGTCFPGAFAPSVITASTTRLGFTIGGGFEARLWSNWLVRAEYRYSDFGTAQFTDSRSCAGTVTVGNTSFSCGGETDITTNELRLRTHTATFGMAYKFD